MIKNILSYFSILCLTSNFILTDLKSEISNSIIVVVGNTLVSSIDIQNEITTNIILNKLEITQENINSNKDYSIKNLISKEIKKNEISKYKITSYNKNDLKEYTLKVAKRLNTDMDGLKKIFVNNNISYKSFIEKHKTELLWNTLIYQLYNNQINVNIIAVENEVTRIINSKVQEFNLSEIEISTSKFTQNKLKEVLKSIKNKGFQETAKETSIADSAKNNGNIGWVSSESLSREYLKEFQSLNINEISRPMRNNNSVKLFKINDIKMRKENAKIKDLKIDILEKKKIEKLALFSRSHFLNLENSMSIRFP